MFIAEYPAPKLYWYGNVPPCGFVILIVPKPPLVSHATAETPPEAVSANAGSLIIIF